MYAPIYASEEFFVRLITEAYVCITRVLCEYEESLTVSANRSLDLRYAAYSKRALHSCKRDVSMQWKSLTGSAHRSPDLKYVSFPSVWQCVAVCCSVLQCVADLRYASFPSVWQCVAVCGSVLQCVVVCCRPQVCLISKRGPCII